MKPGVDVTTCSTAALLELLRGWADGAPNRMAAVELLAGTDWLARAGVRQAAVRLHRGGGEGGCDVAALDLAAAIRAVEDGALTSTYAGMAMLWLAAALLYETPADAMDADGGDRLAVVAAVGAELGHAHRRSGGGGR